MPDDLLRVIDMHGEFAYWADEDEARRLLRMGYSVPRGTKAKIHELRLIVSLGKAAEVPVDAGRELAGFPRDRYLFREDIEYTLANGESRHAPGFKLKEIPSWQLRFFGPMTHREEYQRREAPKKHRARKRRT